ncbi:MAG: histidine kinase dimerization/phospho-acceptor domain-containing protein [Actinomycetota bacterium]
MKLRTRLTIVSAVVTTLSTLVIGAIAINSQHDSQVALLDKSINQVVLATHGKTTSAVSEALYSVDQSDIALTLIYFTDPQTPTVLSDSNFPGEMSPTKEELEMSFKKPVTHHGVTSFRLRSIHLAGEEYLLVAGSMQEIDERYRTDRTHLAFFIFICLLLAISTTWYFIRRDVRKIEVLITAASDISEGNTERQIESDNGNSEVDELSKSLGKMVESLRKMAKAEEESAQRMQNFLGDASHELRTPLTVIKGYVELLAGTSFTDEPQRSRAYERVKSEILRMQSLIDDLLFLAEFGISPTSGNQSVALSELLESHLADFKALHPERNVNSNIEPNVYLTGSEPHLERMLSNIFGNIGRHTPADAPVQAVLWTDQSRIHLEIEDGGPGLPQSAYEGGIQNFERFDKSRSREAGGSGLGMSIIFAIVREHSGTMSLTPSALGGLSVKVNFAKLVK